MLTAVLKAVKMLLSCCPKKQSRCCCPNCSKGSPRCYPNCSKSSPRCWEKITPTKTKYKDLFPSKSVLIKNMSCAICFPNGQMENEWRKYTTKNQSSKIASISISEQWAKSSERFNSIIGGGATSRHGFNSKWPPKTVILKWSTNR
jgi:hypothetical protein